MSERRRVQILTVVDYEFDPDVPRRQAIDEALRRARTQFDEATLYAVDDPVDEQEQGPA